MKINEKMNFKGWRRLLSLSVAMSIVSGLVLSPLSVFSVENKKEITAQPTVEQVQFESAADAEKFDLYHSSNGGFAVQDGKLTPTGDAGEFKAIYKSGNKRIKSVSVELHPEGTDGPICGGLYLNATDAADAQDQINSLYVGVESSFTGWADAPNRIDLITGSFPVWEQLGTTLISETGTGNNLFSGGVKEPIQLKVDIVENQLTATLSLVSNPDKKVSSSYEYICGGDLSGGSVGIRSQHNNACYDNLIVEYYEDVPQQETVTVTETVEFEALAIADRFAMHSSSNGGFAIAEGKLAPAGEGGEFKAIYEKVEGAKIHEVSVDIYPGASGTLVGGLYINAKNAGNNVDQINALNINVDSNFSGWSDAPNRIDLIVGRFPVWTELHRVISETGNHNNLFTDGVKEAVRLKVAIHGNQLDITLSLLSDPDKSVSFSYLYQGAGDLSEGDVGIRSPFNDATYDNFTVKFTAPKPAQPEVTERVDFEVAESSEKFNFYHSSNGGFAVENGKLVSTGESGEFKAIYKDTNASFSYVSVDIYPGANGINGGLYLDVTNVKDAVDQTHGLYIGIESDFPKNGEPAWADAPNRLDLVLGKFPVWQELHRVISETGAGNNLFAGGVKEPVNLSVSIEDNKLTVTVRLLSNPFRYVSFEYTYADGQEIALGNVGIRSGFSDASYDNFAVCYNTVEADKEPEPVVPTDTVDFEAAESGEKFNFYHSSEGGFAVQDGKLVPTGDAGEFKAIYKDTNASFSYVSVDIYPGAKGINGGLYLDVTNVKDAVDQAEGLYIGIESDFPKDGAAYWEDAPNRLDLVLGKFPQWQELHRVISETGAGNNLFTGGVKEPVNLSVFIDGNKLTATVRLLSNPYSFISFEYTYADGQEIALGNVGIRSGFSDASYDNFAVCYSTVEADKEPDSVPEEPIVPTDIVNFEAADDSDKFSFYHSSNGGFTIQDGKLVPTGEVGEFKAIYKDVNAKFEFVSVDIYPGASGNILGGLYIDVTDPDHPQDKINALAVMLEGDFPREGEAFWNDAVNRVDLVVGTFPQWRELHRVVSETGNGNALFAGQKEPVNLKVKIEGNKLTITLSLVSDPSKNVTTTYEYADAEELALGNVGIRSLNNACSYDNFAVGYTTVEADKEPDIIEPPVEEDPIEPTDKVTFDSTEDGGKFNFYHSSNGGFVIQDGKLVPTGEVGEFKAIYKDVNAKFDFVSVDIYPGASGNILGGLYIDVTDPDHPQDKINALAVMLEGDFPREGEASWDDAVNRVDLVVGTFPQWRELHRVVSETGNSNALFAGQKEPVNLKVEIDGNKLTITLSLVSDHSKNVTTTYEYADAEELALGNVGIRSLNNACSYDNFAVGYTTVEADKDLDVAIPDLEPTDVVHFDVKEDSKKFDFYHSSKGGLAVKDGKLVPAGEEGEFKAIYRDGGNTIEGVSVNIYPGESGQINSGIYIGTSTVEDGVDKIKGLVVMVESSFSGWDDAVNRIDLVVGRFPIWKELHRYTSETGNGNALFAGAKEPLNLSVYLDGNKLSVKLSLLSNPEKYVTTVYEYNGATELPAHNVGLRSAFNDVCFDDFAVFTSEGGGSKDPVQSATGGNTGNSGNASSNGSPDTGDHFRPELLFALMVFSVAAIVVLIWKRDKHHTQKQS